MVSGVGQGHRCVGSELITHTRHLWPAKESHFLVNIMLPWTLNIKQDQAAVSSKYDVSWPDISGCQVSGIPSVIIHVRMGPLWLNCGTRCEADTLWPLRHGRSLASHQWHCADPGPWLPGNQRLTNVTNLNKLRPGVLQFMGKTHISHGTEANIILGISSYFWFKEKINKVESKYFHQDFRKLKSLQSCDLMRHTRRCVGVGTWEPDWWLWYEEPNYF